MKLVIDILVLCSLIAIIISLIRIHYYTNKIKDILKEWEN